MIGYLLLVWLWGWIWNGLQVRIKDKASIDLVHCAFMQLLAGLACITKGPSSSGIAKSSSTPQVYHYWHLGRHKYHYPFYHIGRSPTLSQLSLEKGITSWGITWRALSAGYQLWIVMWFEYQIGPLWWWYPMAIVLRSLQKWSLSNRISSVVDFTRCPDLQCLQLYYTAFHPHASLLQRLILIRQSPGPHIDIFRCFPFSSSHVFSNILFLSIPCFIN